MNYDFLLEKTLRKLSPDLHRRMRDSVVVLQKMLESYGPRFPTFTDHSLLHSMDVLDFCNRIVGEQVDRLSPEEIYVLIMGCYLHDIGMGVNNRDFEAFSKHIRFGDFFTHNDPADTSNTVRAFHNEYSGLFIRKYAALFDIPSDELTFAIIQVSRGHRKTNLFDDTEYPVMHTESGVIRTAYLAAVLRLADEIDVASDRNPELLFDREMYIDTEKSRIEFGKHESIRRVEVQPGCIALYSKPKSPKYVPLIEELAGKIQETLDLCRDAAASQSDLCIRQEKVVILPIDEQEGTAL